MWVRFSVQELVGEVTVVAPVWSSDEVMLTFMLGDAARRLGAAAVHLVLPYLPYARQDRVTTVGESHSLRVFCDLVNLQGYKSVTVWDVHSDVALAVLNNVKNLRVEHFIAPLLRKLADTTILVAPDAGAIKKVEALAKAYGFAWVRADKSRDPVTGALSGAVVYAEHVGTRNFLIVDDICDGGRTFLNLEAELRKLTDGRIDLYVTHGIFSAGYPVIASRFANVYVAHLLRADADVPKNIHVFPYAYEPEQENQP